MNVTKSLIAGAIFLFAAPSTGVASDDPYQPTDAQYQTIYDCLEASRGSERKDIEHACVGIVADPCLNDPQHQSTQGMAGCARREDVIWDSLLNDWYGAAREAMPKSVRKEFRKTQRVWIKWRDAKCHFERMKYEGGTMGIPIAAYCQLETTARRALELRGLVVEFEGR